MSFKNLKVYILSLFIVCLSASKLYSEQVGKGDSLSDYIFELEKNDDLVFDEKSINKTLEYFKTNPDINYIHYWYASERDYFLSSSERCKLNFGIRQEKLDADVFDRIGNIFLLEKDYSKALKYYLKAASFYLNNKDTVSFDYANSLLSISLVLKNQKKYDKADKVLKRVFNILKKHKTHNYNIRYFIVKGLYYSEQNKLDSALSYYNLGLDACNSSLDKPYYINLILFKAINLFKLNQKEVAYALLDDAIAFARHNLPEKLSQIYQTKAEMFYFDKEYLEAKVLIDSSINKAMQYNEEYKLISLYKTAGRIYHENKLFDDSYEIMLQAMKLVNKNINPYEKFDKFKDSVMLSSYHRHTLRHEEDIEDRNRALYLIIILIMISSPIIIMLIIISRQRLKKINTILKNSIDEVSSYKKIEVKFKELNHKINSQKILSDIIENSVRQGVSIEKFSQDTLNGILETHWFNEKKIGLIILNCDKKIGVSTTRNIDINKLNAYIIENKDTEFRIVKSQKIRSSKLPRLQEITDQQSNSPFLIVPILKNDMYLGTIVLKINDDAVNENIVYTEFMSSVTSTFALKIIKNINEKEKEQQRKAKAILNQELFEKNTKLEQINVRLRELTIALQDKNRKIEEANSNMRSSIQYAKYIQSALLPTRTHLHTMLGDYFLIFKPKDVVSGDFYFVKQVKNFIVISVADCTGHGVAGALLSALSITILDNITKRPEIYTADYVLELLRGKIKNTFKQFGTENNNGLDIAFCIFDTDTYLLQYAGAFNPLIHIRDRKLTEYRAIRNPIGFYPVEERFINNEIQVKKGDLIYMFSDGYYDQIDDVTNKKYSKKLLKKQLLKISNLEMNKQKQVLEENFAKRLGNDMQIDDVTIMGIRIT